MNDAAGFGGDAAVGVGEARYRSLVEALSSVVWTTDADGRFVEPQPSWEAYTGQQWPEHTGFGWADAVHPDDRDVLWERWLTAVGTGEVYETAARIHHAETGSWRWCEVRAAPVRGEGGAVLGWTGTVTDVHDRRSAEQRAAESAARMDTLLRTAPIGLAFFDADLRFVLVNDTLAAMTGLAVDDHLGRPVGDVVPDLVADGGRLVRRVLEREEPALGVSTVVRTAAAPGEDRDWLVSWFPVPDTSDGPGGVGLTVVDVTERKRTEERLADERQVVETLHWVGTTLSAELDHGRLVQGVTDAATLLTGAQFGAFFYNVVDRDGESYMLYTISGVPREAFEVFAMPRNTEIFHPTFSGEAVVRLDDVTADPRYGRNAPHSGIPEGHLPVRSYLAVPVVSRSGDVLGGLFFGHEKVGVFGEREEQLAVGIAAQAAVGMDNAALYEAVRRAERRQALLARASAQLTTSLEPEGVLRRLAGIVVPELADLCEVDLLEPSGRLRRFIHSAGAVPREVEEHLERRPIDLEGEHPIARVLRSGEPMLMRDVPESLFRRLAGDDEHLDAAVRLGIRRAVIVPLQASGRVLGALSLVARDADRRLDQSDLDLAEDLADRTAVALENARLYDQQREAALILQRSLLPAKIDVPPGMQVAVRYLPGGEGLEAGGDWYDVVALERGRLAVTVGDVMGRGINAAARMGQLRNGLRAYLVEERSPADALTRLEVFADPARTFVTTACGIVDPAARTLLLTNAGHLPPLVLVPGEEPRFLREPLSVPLGTVVVGPPLEEATIDLPPDCTVVLFTDGLVERRDESIEDGLERLRQVAATLEGQPDLEAFTDALVAAMLDDQPTVDDVALLAVWLP